MNAGKKRRWDAVASHPSVAVLLYHRSLNAFLLVRQFRPAVYAASLRNATENDQPKPHISVGLTFELCAGIVDKPDLSLEGIAKEEIFEEVGFDVPVEKIRKVTGFISAVGISGARQTIFAAEVDDSMLPESVRDDGNHGGGLADHGEAIEVVALPVDNAECFLLDDTVSKSSGAMFALMWGLQQLKKYNGKSIFKD